jgi:two-component system cell cycle sensor histidine kinase/response regulator CckA
MRSDRICGKRILLVDDQQGVRQAIRLLLQVDNHEVTEATSGSEALELFGAGGFDLVVTDYDMPGMQGNELALSIKRVTPSQPIIMITAFIEEVGGQANPVDAILGKPFSFQELRQTIATVLQKHLSEVN